MKVKFKSHYLLLALFIFVALISIFYSIDKRYTTIRGVTFLAFYVFLLGLNSWINDKEKINSLFNTLFIALSLCLLINFLSLILFPEKAWWAISNNRFQGLLGHPNSMGAFCMILYPILFWKYKISDSKIKYFIVFLTILTLFLHILSGSRTSLIASIFGIFLWSVIISTRYMPIIIGLIISLISISIILGNIPSSFLDNIPSNFRREKSSDITFLSGRPEIWKATALIAMEKPLLGYGYDVGGKIFEDPRFYNKNLRIWSGSVKASLHNGYLSVIIGVGFTGFLIFCLTLLIPIKSIINTRNNEIKTSILVIFSMCLLTNIFETSISNCANIESVVFWISWVVAGKMVDINKENEIVLIQN